MPEPDLAAGYTLVGPLAHGSAILALDAAGQRVVIKAGPRAAAEADLLARLSGPGWPRLTDRGWTDETPWFATAWVEGRDLSALRGQVDPAAVRHIARAVAAALRGLHALGFVHGDVKPANLRVTPGGDPVLLDLGLAAAVGEPRNGGTAPYLAPGGGPADPADDAYAVGVSLAELLDGSTPWANLPAHQLDLRAAIDLPAAPDDLRLAIRALTEPDPRRRLPLSRLESLLAASRAPELSATLDLGGAPADPGSPRTVGRYHLRGELGRGGMGVVYRAWDPTLRREVAVKVARVSDPARFLREARAAAALDHPAIARVLDVGTDPAGPYLAMELVDGPSLDRLITERGPLPPEEAARLVARLARGLVHAHGRGVIHRDLKPSNVLLGRDGEPRLVDFGLARLDHGDATPLTGSGLIGTPAYLAPEQVFGQGADHRVDVYGLGLILYELLTGRAAFEGANAAAVIREIAGGPPPALRARAPRLPAGLDRITRKATAREPGLRYPTAQALVEDLERWMAGGSIAMPAALARATAWAWVRRHAVGLTVAVAASAAVLVGLGLAADALARSWAVYLHEQEAAAAREATEVVVGAHRAAGRSLEADAAFEAFVANPSWRGTRALSQAWLDAARHADDEAERRASLAKAVFEATHDAERSAALDALARLATDRWDWVALAGMLAADAPDPEDHRARSLRWATGGRPPGPARPDGAEPALDALVGATRTTWSADQVLPATLDGQAVLVLVHDHRLTGAVVGLQSASLTQVLTLPPSPRGGHFAPIRGQGGLLVRGAGINRVTTLTRGGLVDLASWAGPAGLGGWRGDLDADGAPEILAGTGPYERQLRGFRDRGQGFVPFVPHPPTDATSSDVLRVDAADLDADGDTEVVALLGPWGAFDVRVLEPDPAAPDALRLVARSRLGGGADLALLPDPRGGVRVVVPVRHKWSAPALFGTQHPHGSPEGLWVLALRGGALVTEQHLPTPLACAWLVPGDFDGDGIVDLAVDCGQGTAIARQDADGRLHLGAIRRVLARAAGDVDADGRDELIVTLADDPSSTVWVLGAGDDPPPIQVEPPAPAAPPPGASPTVARRWTHAEELRTMGLVAESIAAFQQVAGPDEPAMVRGAALRRAAALVPEERCLEATPMLELAARQDPAGSASDLEQIATCATTQMAWALAQDATRRQLAAPTTPEAERARARARDQSLRARGLHLAHAWDLSRGTPDDVGIVDPLALRETAGGLAFTADRADLLRVPVRWTGGALEVRLDLTLAHLAWSSNLEVGVALPGEPEALYGASLVGLGGGGATRPHLQARWGVDRRGARALPTSAGPVSLRVFADGPRWRVTAETPSGNVEVRGAIPVEAAPAGDYDLVVRARPAEPTSALATGVIHRLSTRGVSPRQVPDPDPAARALTVRQPDRVGPGAGPLAQVVAADDRGDSSAALAGFALLSAAEAGRLVRARPARAMPWLRATRADWLVITAEALEVALTQHPNEPATQALLMEHLGPLPTDPPTETSSREAWITLRTARAAALRAAGRWDAAIAELDLLAEADRPAVHLERARTLAARGNPDAAFSALQLAIRTSPSPLVAADAAAVDPALTPLRSDPRWEPTLSRKGEAE